MREATSYVCFKLTEAVQDFVHHRDVDRLLEQAATTLRFHRYEELPQHAMESMLSLRLALGLEIPEIAIPLPSPWPLRRLPAQRKEELGVAVVSAVRELSKVVGAVNALKKAVPADDLTRLARIVAYSHLAWEGYRDCDAYLHFLRDAFPAYPDDVLVQWLQRHGRHALGLPLSEALAFEHLKFRKSSWPLQAVLAASTRDDAHFKRMLPEEDGRYRVERLSADDHWLARQMLSTGTWPVAPIFLADGAMAPQAEGAQPGTPLLLEGHTRYEYLGELAQLKKANAEHEVWVACIDARHVIRC